MKMHHHCCSAFSDVIHNSFTTHSCLAELWWMWKAKSKDMQYVYFGFSCCRNVYHKKSQALIISGKWDALQFFVVKMRIDAVFPAARFFSAFSKDPWKSKNECVICQSGQFSPVKWGLICKASPVAGLKSNESHFKNATSFFIFHCAN